MNKEQREPNILEYAIVIIMVIVSTIAALFSKVILPKKTKDEQRNENT